MSKASFWTTRRSRRFEVAASRTHDRSAGRLAKWLILPMLFLISILSAEVKAEDFGLGVSTSVMRSAQDPVVSSVSVVGATMPENAVLPMWAMVDYSIEYGAGEQRVSLQAGIWALVALGVGVGTTFDDVELQLYAGLPFPILIDEDNDRVLYGTVFSRMFVPFSGGPFETHYGVGVGYLFGGF